MRSFDYSHFEFVLGATLEPNEDPAACADELRKGAMRLADKAVQQYKIAKANHSRLATEARDHRWELDRIERIKAMPETERSTEEKALLKLHADKVWEGGRRFDYQDQWDGDDAED